MGNRPTPKDIGSLCQGHSGAGRKGHSGWACRGWTLVPVKTQDRKEGLAAEHKEKDVNLLPRSLFNKA